jgi:hypothetical protein
VTLEDLQACDPEGTRTQTDAAAALKRKLEKFNLSHVRALFATPKLAFSTGLIMLIWALIGKLEIESFGLDVVDSRLTLDLGLGFPLYNAFLPYIQATRGAKFHDGSTYITYRNSLIIAVLGVPGALIGGLLVEIPQFGRKGALAMSTVLTGVFLYASTTATTSNALLGWNCAYNFCSNIMYAVLYAYTPEVFPTKDRGTGNALAATANRIFGIVAVSTATVCEFSSGCVRTDSANRSLSSPCSQTCRPRRQCTRAALSSLPRGSLSLCFPSSRRGKLVFNTNNIS